MTLLGGRNDFPIPLDIAPNILDMVKVIRKRGMNFAKCQIELICNLIRRHPLALMPHCHILHANTVSGEAWSSACYTARCDNALFSLYSCATSSYCHFCPFDFAQDMLLPFFF